MCFLKDFKENRPRLAQWTPCLLFIWNDNMREKREANANATWVTWRELIRDRPRGDGV
jgi:hypothetical protein